MNNRILQSYRLNGLINFAVRRLSHTLSNALLQSTATGLRLSKLTRQSSVILSKLVVQECSLKIRKQLLNKYWLNASDENHKLAHVTLFH